MPNSQSFWKKLEAIHDKITVVTASRWFPELKLLPNITEQAEVFIKSEKPGSRSFLALIAVGISFAACVFFGIVFPIALLQRLVENSFPDKNTAVILRNVFAPVCIAITLLTWNYLMFSLVVRKHIRRAIRNELALKGCKICGHCGYDLRGSRGKQCSECGTTLCPQQLINTKSPAQ